MVARENRDGATAFSPSFAVLGIDASKGRRPSSLDCGAGATPLEIPTERLQKPRLSH
jgi:hypothetical protein